MRVFRGCAVVSNDVQAWISNKLSQSQLASMSRPNPHTPHTLVLIDCKSAGFAFAGSNPALPTIIKNNGLRDFCDLVTRCYFEQFAPFLPQTSPVFPCHPFLDKGFQILVPKSGDALLCFTSTELNAGEFSLRYKRIDGGLADVQVGSGLLVVEQTIVTHDVVPLLVS